MLASGAELKAMKRHVGHGGLAALARGLDFLEDVGEPPLKISGEPLDLFEVQRASRGQLQHAQARSECRIRSCAVAG